MQRWKSGRMWGLLACGLLAWAGRAAADCGVPAGAVAVPHAAVSHGAVFHGAVPQALFFAAPVASLPQTVVPQAVVVPLAHGAAYGANVLAVPTVQPVVVEVRTVTRRGVFGRSQRVTRRIQR